MKEKGIGRKERKIDEEIGIEYRKREKGRQRKSHLVSSGPKWLAHW